MYYQLTKKGEHVIEPKFPVQFILVLSLGILLMMSSVYTQFLPGAYTENMITTGKNDLSRIGGVAVIIGENDSEGTIQAVEGISPGSEEKVDEPSTKESEPLTSGLLLVGIILTAAALARLRSL